MTQDEFLARARAVHGESYDYSCVSCVAWKKKVKVICRQCNNAWMVTPNNHISRVSGCPTCTSQRNTRKTLDEFIVEAVELHESKYDYRRVRYQDQNTRIEIGCNRCGFWFNQRPVAHLHGNGKRGCGCPRCAREVKGISRYEQEWLDKLSIPNERRQHWMTLEGRNVCIDALWQNVAYEFLGKFWHGDPREYDHEKMNTLTGSTFGELYRKTLERLTALERFGFDVRFVWEKDYNAGLLFSPGHPIP